MPDHPMQTPAREPTQEELEERAEASYALHQRIVAAMRDTTASLWTLAKALYEFDERRGWVDLGSDYEKLSDWLADPEVGMPRSTYYRLVRSYRDTVVRRQIPETTMAEVDPSKVAIVIGRVNKGEVKIDDALEDAKALGARDLRVKYLGEPEERAKDGPPVKRSGLSVDELNKVSQGDGEDSDVIEGELAQNGDSVPSGQVDDEPRVFVPRWAVERLVAMEGSKRIPVDVLAALKDALEVADVVA